MPFSIVRGDIARIEAQAVVNAANSYLAAGGGVCGAIFSAAGAARMERACREIGHCDVGSAVVTPGFDLPARYVIHAVGPVWRGGAQGEPDLLRRAYRSAFDRAAELGVSSVALPLISAGIYGYPVAGSLELATSEARRFLEASPDAEVTLVVFDRKAFACALERHSDVAELISDAEASRVVRRRDNELNDLSFPDAFVLASMPAARTPIDEDELACMLDRLDTSFSQAVLALIDERGLTDAEVYKRANLSRQLFSKIRHDNGYRPAKPTAVALALALELTPHETDLLLARAGYALGGSSKFDVIVSYFIERGCHDVFRLNEMLFAFDQPLVGSV